MSISTDRFSIIEKAKEKNHVIKVLDKLNKKTVWIKQNSSNSGAICKEFEVINRIDSDFIIRAFEYNNCEGYIILEDVGKIDLQKKLRTKQSKSVLLSLSNQISLAFCDMEYAGIHYRDLMDAHIFVDSKNIVKIIDFNNVLLIESDSTYINKTTAGFYKTMAPEEHDITMRLKNSGVYSLCSMIYRIFMGHYPVDSLITKYKTTHSIINSEEYKILNKYIQHSKLLSKKQNGLLASGLNYNPELRPRSIKEFYEEFFGKSSEVAIRNDFSYWMLNDNIGVTHRPGFYKDRIFRKTTEKEIDEFYKNMKNNFSICLCLLTNKEMNHFNDRKIFQSIGERHFKNHICFELKSKPVVNEDIIKLINMLIVEIENGEKVLIHCNAGIGRACTISTCLIAQLNRIHEESMSVEELVKIISSKRNLNTFIENTEQLIFIKDYLTSMCK